jgi:hypothetical protein
LRFAPRFVHSLLISTARFLASFREQMPIRVERDFDTGMAHLIAHIRGCLTVGDKLRSEEVPEVVKPGTRHLCAFRDGPPDFGIKLVGINEPAALNPGRENPTLLPS